MSEDARQWVGGKLPTAEYYAKVYAQERQLAEQQVERALSVRRSARRSSASAGRSVSP